ncbi:hypothetical protein IWQ56_006117, partial [Coemansia nantahalensis]
MDVDAAHIPRVLVPLTDQDREYCAANGLCFRCRQPGHSSRDCTRSFNHRNSNSNNNNHRNNNNRNNNNPDLIAGPTRGRFDLVVAPVRYDIIVGLPWIAWANAAVDWDCRRLHTRYGVIAEHRDETPAAPDAMDVIDSMDMKVLAKHGADPLDGAVSEYLIHQLDAHAADDLPADEPLPTPPAHPKAAQLALEFAD